MLSKLYKIIALYKINIHFLEIIWITSFAASTIFILAGCTTKPQTTNNAINPTSTPIVPNNTAGEVTSEPKPCTKGTCFGSQNYSNGNKYVGEFFDGRRSGFGIEYSISSLVLRSGKWLNDNLVQPEKLNVEQFPFMLDKAKQISLELEFERSRQLAISSNLVFSNLKDPRLIALPWKDKIDQAVNKELMRWLTQSESILDLISPPIYPEALSLKQDYWETNKEFETRVGKARQDRSQIIDQLQSDYRLRVEERNRRVDAFNKMRAEREAALPTRRRLLIRTVLDNLPPSIVLSDVAFDQQTGTLTLAAEVESLDKQVFAFTDTAQALRRTALTEPQSLLAKPEFEVTDAGDIVLKAITVEAGGASARGLPSSGVSSPVQLATVTLPQAAVPAVSQQSAVTVDRNQVEQILYRDENELLRKRLEEQRRQQEQAVALAEARAASENARLRAEVEALRNQPGSPRLPQNLAKVNEAHALVIGNSAYAGSNRLANPVNDARAMAAKLRALGFKVTEIRDAGRAQMVRGLAEFSRTAERADLTLLFYAGHGVQIAGTNYMIPTDTSLSDAGQAALQAVPLNQAVEQYLPGKTKLVFLDACRDNPLMASGSRSIAKGLAPISVSEGTLIAYATKDGQTAEDGTGQTNSPFTAALLEHLADPDDIAVVLRTVRSKVMQRTNNRQQPWEYGSLTGGALVLSAIRR